MKDTFTLGNREIGYGCPPFVIAEMSGNHNRSLGLALEIVEEAARAGADAIKLQTYTAETMTLNIKKDEFLITSPASLWHGKSLYELYEEAHTPWEWHEPIFTKARKLGLLAFSTPFDVTAVDFLEKLDVPCYKIASFENSDIPLIRKVSSTGKPIIISTGMATVSEIEETVYEARKAGAENIILLKCTSAYPAEPADANIRTIPHMKELFSCDVGLSDHTLGTGVAIAAVSLGAVVVEKHFTLRRADGGVDSAFSLEPEEFKDLTKEIRNAWDALGKVSYVLDNDKEKESRKYRRSLYVSQNIQQGEPFTLHNVKSVRPGLGLAPKYMDTVLGCRAACSLKSGTPLKMEHLQFK